MIELLNLAPWAKQRTFNEVKKAVDNSLVLGANDGEETVAILRATTDKVTVTYLCDLFVAETHRHRGVGTRLMRQLLRHPDVCRTTVVLLTSGAEEFYRRLGFVERTCMLRRPDAQS